MAMKKTGTHTNDRVNVGTHVRRAKSMGAAKNGAGDGRVVHAGQPKGLGGSGFKTGHNKTNTGY